MPTARPSAQYCHVAVPEKNQIKHMPTAVVRAVGIDLTALGCRLRPGHQGHLYADGHTSSTAAVGVVGDMPTAFLCLRLPSAQSEVCRRPFYAYSFPQAVSIAPSMPTAPTKGRRHRIGRRGSQLFRQCMMARLDVFFIHA